VTRRVAIVGVGYSDFRPATPDVAFHEMMFEAAVKAYEDAGVNPRKDIDSFIACSEDYWEGFSIFDEFVPDQLGAVLKPVCTISADGMYGVINAYLQIRTGAFDIVAVEAHSKASDIVNMWHVMAFAFDPIINRPLKMHPYVIAGLEMMKFLKDSGNTEEHCAMVVAKNKKNAMKTPYASYGSIISPEDVLTSETLFHPLKKLDASEFVDGAVVIVLAAEEVARKLTDTPIWIKGVGWCTDTPWLEFRDWSRAVYAEMAAEMAYKMARIHEPAKQIDFAEIDDKFSYKELQHMEALRLCRKGEAGLLVEEGVTERDGDLPVNPSGGFLGVGNPLEAGGLVKILEAVLQLRGEAGKRQVPKAEVAVTQIWRGVPTTSGAVVVLGRE